MEEEKFIYIKGKTRRVCRNCGMRYSDFFFSDECGMCDDCLVDTGHLGMTNLPQNQSEEAKMASEETIKRMVKN